MAEHLRKCRDRQDAYQCAAYLYTAESFLYPLVNATLRNDDRSKIDTLGPYCSLLFTYIKTNKDPITTELYRGTILTPEMINEYKQAVGTKIVWSSFTSTSKDRRVANSFGNTLFVIKEGLGIPCQKDMSALSEYPSEQEVLFYAGHTFTVDKVELDPKTGKYVVYMGAV